MLSQSISWPGCFPADIAGVADITEMVYYDVGSYIKIFSFFSTNLANECPKSCDCGDGVHLAMFDTTICNQLSSLYFGKTTCYQSWLPTSTVLLLLVIWSNKQYAKICITELIRLTRPPLPSVLMLCGGGEIHNTNHHHPLCCLLPKKVVSYTSLLRGCWCGKVWWCLWCPLGNVDRRSWLVWGIAGQRCHPSHREECVVTL